MTPGGRSALHLWLGHKHGCSLVLHILGLGLLVFWVGSWKLEEAEAPLLSSRALGRHVEHLQGRAHVLVDGGLLLILTS